MKDQQEKFLRLYNPIHESFARFCHSRAYGIMEPEDLIAESVLKALEKINSLRDENAFLSFMFTIAKNIVNGKHRRTKFQGNYTEKEVIIIPDEGCNAEVKHDISVLYQALNLLPEKQKEAIILFEISGFSIKEIAKIQNSGESAIKQRLKRGRETLANLLRIDQLKQESIEKRSSVLLSMFF